KSHTIQYIDWENPENNVFHLTEEFSVMRTGRKDTYRPDIVLFVNGIPLAVIRGKGQPSKGPTKRPMPHKTRTHQKNGIQHLYVYSQILMALSLTEAKYATTNTKEEFWAVWKEKDERYQNTIQELVNRPLASELVDKLFAHPDIRTVADRKSFEEKYALP